MSEERKAGCCPQGCTLKRFRIFTKGFGCDVCKAKKEKFSILFGCRECDWDACPGCCGKDNDPAIDVLTEHPAGIAENIKPKKFDPATGHPAAIRKVRKSWVPLESNPDLLNSYLKKLGASGANFAEIYGFDDEMLAWVPQPVRGVLLCFPITENSENFRHEEEKLLEEKGQEVSSNVYHIKQTVGNACGTIALLHTVLNNPATFTLEDGKFWKKFHAETKDMDSTQRAKALEENEDIEEEHQSVAASGGSNASHAVNDNMHFIVLGEVDGCLYELDGRKQRPINHGPTTDVLRDAIKVVRKFMAFAPEDIRLNAVALVAEQ